MHVTFTATAEQMNIVVRVLDLMIRSFILQNLGGSQWESSILLLFMLAQSQLIILQFCKADADMGHFALKPHKPALFSSLLTVLWFLACDCILVLLVLVFPALHFVVKCFKQGSLPSASAMLWKTKTS